MAGYLLQLTDYSKLPGEGHLRPKKPKPIEHLSHLTQNRVFLKFLLSHRHADLARPG